MTPTDTNWAQASWAFLKKGFLALLTLIFPRTFIKTVKIFFLTVKRDAKITFVGALVVFKSYYYQVMNKTALSLFNDVKKRLKNKPCFLFEDKIMTFNDVDEYSSKLAKIFYDDNFRKGDVIALVMTNRAEYAAYWLGLAKIGVVSALINTNLKGQSLTHCIKTSFCKAVIYSDDLAGVVEGIMSSLDGTIKYYQLGGTTKPGVTNLEPLLNETTPTVPDLPYKIDHDDQLVYIFTSGTTGFPKAAIIPHSRFLLVGLFSQHLLKIRPRDVVYNPLPLYHTAGGLLGIGTAILLGSTVAIRSKFSASSYISDCRKYKCTVGQYIGEMCRYILSVPPKPSDQEHCLRMIVGNGLRPVIWTKFIERFKIPKVMEVYGSTEGNLQFVNIDNKHGAVGSIPRFLPFSHLFGAIIKVDMETMEPIRNKDGFCIKCDYNETGMFVGVIPGKRSLKEVHGYLDKKESSKKFIYDVFKKGDKAFVSGDLMVMDEYGYLYFKDRTGDTFRWKGENISTSEVEALISSILSLKDCSVYGVEIGDLEGRAGMAAIVDPDGQVDLNALAAGLSTSLPAYAHPIFVRLLKSVELTGTFKLKKFNLQSQGFDPRSVKDPLFYKKGSSYLLLTPEAYDQIMSGQVKL